MQAHQIMKKQVIKVKETSSVRSVIEKFIEHGISGLPVVNDNNEIVGYISDGDVMRFIGKHKSYVIDMFAFVNVIEGDDVNFEERARKILDLNVLEIAKKKIIKVAWNDDIENVAAVLGEKQIKKLPVERNGVLVGIISRGDVIRDAFKTLL
ncbi:CBS domain-containing protein [Aquibacillus sp. 3ASR75-11]|uniref:CBS domain-containing protein n=1 Tax=Terrihalobacillus insolitus TaxID=2950438 RepID=A0A9X3WTK9_9BACI|nr:CBS domain-containing protein [Terrihalobacillus insolitus]MDC3412212.1 CBS domain-containing protein [Terrihalobacillus insolitus]MDC3423094.1 CBS domain-containing protein [Terrihalobacillus insolitus]